MQQNGPTKLTSKAQIDCEFYKIDPSYTYDNLFEYFKIFFLSKDKIAQIYSQMSEYKKLEFKAFTKEVFEQAKLRQVTHREAIILIIEREDVIRAIGKDGILRKAEELSTLKDSTGKMFLADLTLSQRIAFFMKSVIETSKIDRQIEKERKDLLAKMELATAKLNATKTQRAMLEKEELLHARQMAEINEFQRNPNNIKGKFESLSLSSENTKDGGSSTDMASQLKAPLAICGIKTDETKAIINPHAITSIVSSQTKILKPSAPSVKLPLLPLPSTVSLRSTVDRSSSVNETTVKLCSDSKAAISASGATETMHYTDDRAKMLASTSEIKVNECVTRIGKIK